MGPELSPSGHLSPGSPRGQLPLQSGEQPILTVSAASCHQITAMNLKYQRLPLVPLSTSLPEACAGQGLTHLGRGELCF